MIMSPQRMVRYEIESKYLHVREGLVPDVMHDMLEGYAPYVVKELLKYLDQNSIVTLEELNVYPWTLGTSLYKFQEQPFHDLIIF